MRNLFSLLAPFSGIFVLSGEVSHFTAGPSVILSFVLASFVAFACALCYAELAPLYPSAGSASTFCGHYMSPLVGFLVGWNIFLEYTLAAAAVGYSWSKNWSSFISILGGNWPAVITDAPFKVCFFCSCIISDYREISITYCARMEHSILLQLLSLLLSTC